MQTTSDLYKSIVEGQHWFETQVVIGDEFYLIDESGDFITFGGTGIYYESDSGGFGGNMLKEVKTTHHVFTDDKPAVGCCVSAEIDITMVRPTAYIERMASIKPYIRACNDTQQSEWLPKGIFFIDTREEGASSGEIKFHGYDALLKTENDFPTMGDIGEWPKTDIETVRYIAELIEVEVDPRTVEIMQRGYEIQYPAGYSQREVLSFIAAAYAGNFIMTDAGKLRLVRLNEIGVETHYLVENNGYVITFGGDSILV